MSEKRFKNWLDKKVEELGRERFIPQQELSTPTVLAQIVSQTTPTSLHRELWEDSGYALIVIQTSS